uniref:c-type cytochrome biogenensis protein n=1 Tax=Pseudoerythrocladia kornmannii TaxID=753682 RepID=UPI001BEE09B8|nr:c-type cytochrome biogenensis protein [Pseudoerythrocladia kornmannii]QUE28188.1 Ccs1 [Pseudoerythrocladia kornmannii]UNJ16692.1 c-type cytochrome biogenensis protein [Pseudoerythrocladia kornmannii]
MGTSFKFKALNIISNLKLSISLLLLIALVTMIGTVVEQDKTLEFYKLNYPIEQPILGIISWQFIQRLGLDHIYTNIWFYLLLLFFACSLVVCTFSKQLPMLKVARTWRFVNNSNQFDKFPLNMSAPIKNLSCSLALLNRQGYFVFQQKEQIYAYKGLIGRVSPIIVHVSIICILFGTIVSSLTGFVAQEVVPKGEVFHIQNVLSAGNLSTISQKCIGRVDDFWIAYNKDGSINQFFSKIILQNLNGEVVKKATISVNSPLKYDGIAIYQTDWNITGLKIVVDDNTLQLPAQPNLIQNSISFWSSHLSLGPNPYEQYTFVIKDLKGFVDLYDGNQKFLSTQKIGETFLCDNFNIKIETVLTSTGLQIKSDPGIPVIYFGFFLLMISSSLSYLTYSQIWIAFASNITILGGYSNRAVVSFEEEFYKLFFSFK